MFKTIYQQFTVKSITGKNVTIHGYASVYDVVDQQNDMIIKSAISNINASDVKFLWQHDMTKPIGKITQLQEDDYGLMVEAVINSATQAGLEAIALVTDKTVTGLSVGLNVLDFYINAKEERVITKANVLEISIVTFPANQQAQITNINNPLQEVNMQLSTENNDNNKPDVNYQIKMLENKVNSLVHSSLRPQGEAVVSERIDDDFYNYIRKGIIDSSLNDNIVQKSFSSNPGEAGVAIVPSLQQKIINKINATSPMRKLASIETISTNALDLIMEDGAFASGWIGEIDARRETDTPKLVQKKILVHEMYAQPKATQALIDDSAVKIENWIGERLSDSFVRIENQAFINGSGNNQPKGILHTDHKIKTIKLKDDNMPALLLDMINDLDETYLANATFLMNRSTLSEIQKLHDENNRSIWQQSLSDSIPQTIYGIPVVCCNEMPLLEKKVNFIAIADFKLAYKIVDRMNITITRDPYTEKPFVKFYAVKRVGGDVVNPDAIRLAVSEA